MSRLLNVDLPMDDVEEQCAAWRVAISAIEPLPAGGTHLVCITSNGADTMRRVFAGKLMAGIVRRYPFYNSRGPW